MKNQWQFLLHVDNNVVVDPYINPFFSNPFTVLYHLFSFVDHSKHLFLSRISTFGKYPFRLEGHKLITHVENVSPNKFNLMGSFFCNVEHFFSGHDDLVVSLPVLSLAATVKPAFDNLMSKVVVSKPADQIPCDVENRGCVGRSFPDFNWMRRAVEPITGIEFPGVLKNIVDEEVLVGTGSKSVTFIKIKSLKIYAFGFYVHPYSVCHKLGSKYASVSAADVKDHSDFYADLLREDIGMTVRLVVNCNGMKINSVKDAFEKSLRDRLVKTNPETDFKCISAFGSFFTKDIPLPVGTVIDFRRTADGQLITEIGGNQIGAVRSKELCRAFFDMYLGEVPVSKQTKEEIGSNVARIVRRC